MELLVDTLIGVFTFRVFFLIVSGACVGIVVGALPGINAPTGIALAIPLTFNLQPAEGLILLGTIYASSIYGGSISAILMNIPGEPGDIATIFDGYPMAKRGEAQRALELSAISSGFGGAMGCIVFLLLSPLLARVALLFGPAEIFWVAIFGVTVIGAISTRNIFNGLLGGTFGMLMSTVGLSPVTGNTRFTLGSGYLLSGINIVSALIGLFALSEMLNAFEEAAGKTEKPVRFVARWGLIWTHLREFFRYRYAMTISTIIGLIIGLIPAASHSIGALIAYGEVKRRSPRQKYFGTGEAEGLVGADTAKNAVVPGALIPLFTIGVPGSPAAAILLGGLIIHGLFPGHSLFTEHAKITYTFMAGFLAAQFIMVVLGIAGARLWGKVTTFPTHFLAPTVIALSVIGSYATRGNTADVLTMTAVGVAMYGAIKVGFEPAPIVIGLVLGQLAEMGFLLGRILGEAEGSVLAYLFLRPIPIVLVALTLASLVISVIMQVRNRSAARKDAKERPSESSLIGEGRVKVYHVNIAVGLCTIIFGFAADRLLVDLEAATKLFPSVLLWICKGIGVCMVLKESIFRIYRNVAPAFGRFQPLMILLVIATIGYIVAALFVGCYISTFAYLIVVPVIMGKTSPVELLTKVLPIAGGVAFILYCLFYLVLNIRMMNQVLI